MKSKIIISLILIIAAVQCKSQEKTANEEKNWSAKIADSFIERHPGNVVYDSLFTKKKWNYEQGLILEGFHQMYLLTGDEKYYNFIKGNIDQFVSDEGEIKTYKKSDFNLDKINPGRALLFLYDKTKIEKYKKAAELLRSQLAKQPRTKSGGFWHKKVYPNQMWLDGLYMGEPFYAWYSKMFNQLKDFDDITHQFILVYEHTVDKKTGLLFHAWDESKEQKWANPVTGTSPNFWGRAIGWYVMAIVDVLDFLPEDHPDRQRLIEILNKESSALLKVKDNSTDLWYQVLDMPDREGNYLETSASAMYGYAFAKGANKGYLSKQYLKEAEKTFDGLLKNKVKITNKGFVNLFGTCSSAGLGGKPYRDGSFEYYIKEPTRMNDIKGYGPFLLLAIELERK